MPPYISKASIEEINKILFCIKQAVSEGKIKFIESRRKNIDTLASFGITTQNVYDIILELTYENYINGPSDDRNYPEDKKTIWEFGYELDSEEMYIKIKAAKQDKIILISFHKAEKPLYFLYKGT